MKYDIRYENGIFVGQVNESVGRYLISTIKGHWVEHPSGKRYILEEDYKIISSVAAFDEEEVTMYLWKGSIIIPSQ